MASLILTGLTPFVETGKQPLAFGIVQLIVDETIHDGFLSGVVQLHEFPEPSGGQSNC